MEPVPIPVAHNRGSRTPSSTSFPNRSGPSRVGMSVAFGFPPVVNSRKSVCAVMLCTGKGLQEPKSANATEVPPNSKVIAGHLEWGLQHRVRKPHLVHVHPYRRVEGVTAEVTVEVAVGFEDRDGDSLSRQKECEHGSCGPPPTTQQVVWLHVEDVLSCGGACFHQTRLVLAVMMWLLPFHGSITR